MEFSDSDDKQLLPKVIELVTFDEAANKVRALVKRERVESKAHKITDDKEPAALESSASEVTTRLRAGCECQGVCFKDLQAENVYRHRLNIAELTKQEHDMYLMGVTMACLSNRKETNRHKERIRQRAVYVFQGKRVCLDAFIYLENVTQYHLKRIRRHVMVNGVTPRVHGNVRKKPHNALSLDLYKFAENFVKSEILRHTNDLNKSVIVVNESRVHLYQKFLAACSFDGKLMSYSTFRHFLKKQFPHVRFASRTVEANQDKSKFIKREKKSKFNTAQIPSGSRLNDSDKIYSAGEYDTEPQSDADNFDEEREICVEYVAAEDSYESDGNYEHVNPVDPKNNEYEDVDFLELEDEEPQLNTNLTTLI